MFKRIAFFFVTLVNLNCTSITHNFYVGLNFSATHMSGVRNDYAVDDNTSAKFNVNKGTRSNGGYGGIFTGYFFRITDFGISPEIFYNYGKIESTSGGTLNDTPNNILVSYRIKNKISNQYGIGSRFGCFLDNYFIYTYLGSQKHLEKFEVVADYVNNGAFTNYFFKKKKQTNRFSFGLGTQKSISNHMEIGIEYRTNRMPRKNYTFYIEDADHNVFKSDFKYRLHMVGVRLIYKF